MPRHPLRSTLFPYTTLFRSHSLGYLADGLTEALIDALRQVPTLTVVSKNGVGLYRSSAVRLDSVRSEEHTSELQSQSNLVCRLLLEKKKKNYSRPLGYNHQI